MFFSAEKLFNVHPQIHSETLQMSSYIYLNMFLGYPHLFSLTVGNVNSTQIFITAVGPDPDSVCFSSAEKHFQNKGRLHLTRNDCI